MWLHEIFQGFRNRAPARRQQARRQCGVRVALEQLEDRTVPSNFTATTVSDLIADINRANTAGGSNTITLAAGNTFTLTAISDSTDGYTGLPVIEAGNNLTIVGNGDTIERASGGQDFRFFDVAAGASLTLANLTLQGGLEIGNGLPAKGGAINNHGTLDLNGVTVQNNIAQAESGGSGWKAYGGGICSDGTLTLEGGTRVQNNQALGGQGGLYGTSRGITWGYPGGNAYGGGVCVLAGTATLTDVTVCANTTKGGQGGSGTRANGSGGNAYGGGVAILGGTATLSNDSLSGNSALGGGPGTGTTIAASGGNAYGGGLDVESATVTLLDDTVSNNSAQGYDSKRGSAEGGGISIDPSALVYLDSFTLKNTTNNKRDNIYGSYALIS
jgi:hypothetical protein